MNKCNNNIIYYFSNRGMCFFFCDCHMRCITIVSNVIVKGIVIIVVGFVTMVVHGVV